MSEWPRPEGVTPRQWFAGIALQSLLWSYYQIRRSEIPPLEFEQILVRVRKNAYEFADAMLKEGEAKDE